MSTRLYRLRLVAAGTVALGLLASPAAAQLRVSSPYLDVVSRYRSGDYLKAVEEVTAFPAAGLRERARRDLLDLTCQVLCGTADCRRAQREKPDEFVRVIEVWEGQLPAAAALHIDAAIALQTADRAEAAEVHREIALALAEQPGAGPAPVTSAPLRRQVALLSLWLLQVRFELPALDAPVARALEQHPGDALVLLLALGSLHGVRARPHALSEASAGRQGNLDEWRREERAFRLEQAAAAYTKALAIEDGLAEAHLRLGRVLMLQGKAAEAEAAFARVPGSTADARWRYLAAMFRASAAEARGDGAGARARYEEALGIWPASQSAALAISRLLASDGDWAAAREKLSAFDGSPSGERPEDPWWAYDFGQAWRLHAGLSALRGLVKP